MKPNNSTAESLSLEEIDNISGGGERLENLGKYLIGYAVGVGVTMATLPCIGMIGSNILGLVFQINIAVYTGLIIPPKLPRRPKHEKS